MNLDLLRSFFAIAEFGSMSKAAEQLHVSQSTLTRQMQTLETEVGGQLMERGHSGVALTAAGHALLLHPGRDVGLDRGRADHAREAERHEHGAGGVGGDIRFEGDGTQLIGAPAVGAQGGLRHAAANVEVRRGAGRCRKTARAPGRDFFPAMRRNFSQGRGN